MPRGTVRSARLATAFALVLAATPSLVGAQQYWPGRHLDWERRSPAQMGLDPALVQEAVRIAQAGESNAPRDLTLNHEMTFGREPRGLTSRR